MCITKILYTLLHQAYQRFTIIIFILHALYVADLKEAQKIRLK